MIDIAVFGLRGYGVIYSGYETFIQFLVSRSNKRKYFYHLYGRKRYKQYENYKKVDNFRVIHVPTAKGKYLETVSYAFIATLHSLFIRIDVVLYLGTANTPLIFIQKLLGRKTIVNTAGIDWKKNRWSIFGKCYLILCEKLTVLFADVILCDSKTVLEYYRKNYQLDNLVYIPYGAEVTVRKPGSLLKKLYLIPNNYFYSVGRISPENGFEDLILAFKKLETNFKCVIIGNSIYEDAYKAYLKRLAKGDDRIVFTGFLKDNDYEEVCSNACAYVDTKDIGGTHPSLLEAMAFGNMVIVKNINENKEVVLEEEFLYQKGNISSLRKQLIRIINNPKNTYVTISKLKKRLQEEYNWDIVISEYEDLFGRHSK